ncbi:MAG: RNA polymerase sigma factor [Phenylobacterium sp.]|uniref:RNA polymerase sigma factor n=1 Tax=Phenylobacterium sp. TaxID=1871053 RepID=UPI00122635FE|nr:RNA polymerase sigma factor [Phenylobacterium sp.]TAJ73437.1 MAG: RNA polymerase sigma factor [Phenylobacterium sp.]
MSRPDEPSDADLARQAAEGSERAYGVLVARHKDRLYGLLRRYLGDPEEAREAAHEAFIAAWAALGRYDPARPFGAWLRTIAINKARDRGRRLAFRRMIFGDRDFEDSGAHEHPDPKPDAEATLLERERLAHLDHGIARLPGPLKEALLLTAIEGLSQQEAAEILDVTVKTIETRLYRARKTLAQTLDPSLRPGR